MNNYIHFLISCVIGFLCSGCGYHCSSEDDLNQAQSTISVPYIKGDVNGALTAAVVKALVSSGAYEYRLHCGAYSLEISQLEIDEENIGFRYDRKKRGKLTRDTIPTEERITGSVEVSLIEVGSGTRVLGPETISIYVEYDHDYYFSRNGVNIYSLGQLSDLEEAYDAVQVPLYKALAQKIVDYITSR